MREDKEEGVAEFGRREVGSGGGAARASIGAAHFENRIQMDSLPVLAWLAENVPALVQHFPAIHGDSAQTKGTVLLSIVSSSFPHRLEHHNHTFHY